MKNDWCYILYLKHPGSLWPANYSFTRRYGLYEVLFSTVFHHVECQGAGNNSAGSAIYLFYFLLGGRGNENSL